MALLTRARGCVPAATDYLVAHMINLSTDDLHEPEPEPEQFHEALSASMSDVMNAALAAEAEAEALARQTGDDEMDEVVEAAEDEVARGNELAEDSREDAARVYSGKEASRSKGALLPAQLWNAGALFSKHMPALHMRPGCGAWACAGRHASVTAAGTGPGWAGVRQARVRSTASFRVY